MPCNQTGTAAGPQAGWYQDPSGNPQLRWWDGSQWTSQVTPQPGYSVAPPAQEPPAHPTLPSPLEAWRLWTDDPGAAGTDPGAAAGPDARTSGKGRIKKHKVITVVTALTIFAIGVFIVAGSWGGALLLIALGAFAGWVHGKKMRKTTYALTGLLVLVAIGGTASAFSSSPGPQAQRYSGPEVECGYFVHDDGAIGEYIILGSMNSFSCNAGLNAIQSNWSADGGPVPAITNSDPISNYEQNATVACDGYMGDYYVTVDSATGDACSALGLS